jgi:acetyl esterase/lipase
MSLSRKLLIAAGGVVGLLVIGGAVVWILKPWVPDITLADPGPTGERVVERGIFANYFPATGSRSAPGVMLLGGSEGGIGENTTDAARVLQRAGFNVLTPSYFGAPGQPEQLELIPLETFDRALDWLLARPEVDDDRLAVAGQSKGAEAALLVGVRHPELSAVIATAPTSAVWPEIGRASWRERVWTIV